MPAFEKSLLKILDRIADALEGIRKELEDRDGTDRETADNQK